MLFSFVLISILFVNACISQMIPPLLPEEYTCNVIQKKWNLNGQNVNHTYSGIWYSSYKEQKIRFDGLEASTNHTNILQSVSLQISILDFSTNPMGINYYYDRMNLEDKGECFTGPVTGFFAPPKATFLRDIGAIFAGWDYDTNYGQCQKWSFYLVQLEAQQKGITVKELIKYKILNDYPYNPTTITFWVDLSGSMVRWDLIGLDLQTGVQTYQYNVLTNIDFAASNQNVFASNCTA
eukprot:25487_1